MTFVLALVAWMALVVFGLLPLMKAAQRADDDYRRLVAKERARAALRRAADRARSSCPD